MPLWFSSGELPGGFPGARLSLELPPPTAAETGFLDDDGDETDAEEEEDNGNHFLQNHENSRVEGIAPKGSVMAAGFPCGLMRTSPEEPDDERRGAKILRMERRVKATSFNPTAVFVLKSSCSYTTLSKLSPLFHERRTAWDPPQGAFPTN